MIATIYSLISKENHIMAISYSKEVLENILLRLKSEGIDVLKSEGLVILKTESTVLIKLDEGTTLKSDDDVIIKPENIIALKSKNRYALHEYNDFAIVDNTKLYKLYEIESKYYITGKYFLNMDKINLRGFNKISSHEDNGKLLLECEQVILDTYGISSDIINTFNVFNNNISPYEIILDKFYEASIMNEV